MIWALIGLFHQSPPSAARVYCVHDIVHYMNCERVFRAAQRNAVGNNNNNNILLPSADVTVLSENVERIIIIIIGI